TGMNRALREQLGAEPGERQLGEAFGRGSAHAVNRIRELVDEAVGSGQSRELHAEPLNLFGHEASYRVQAVPLAPGFPATRTLVLIEDVTESERLATQLLRAERLSSVGLVAAGIAHEIGTPLSVVRAKAELALGKLPTGHPLARVFDLIIGQIDRIVRTV